MYSGRAVVAVTAVIPIVNVDVAREVLENTRRSAEESVGVESGRC
jgi:hypothetical protein